MPEWNDEKLFYVERYMEIFTKGMTGKWAGKLAYLDFFSGPGRCIEHATGRETDGSPIRSMNYGFSRRLFNDSSAETVSALEARVRALSSGGTARIENGDCNLAVLPARQLMEGGYLGLAFIDPFAYRFTFESLKRMTADLPIDLIITFMTSFPKRFIGQPGFTAGSDFDRFMGTPEWLGLGSGATFREILDIYEGQLRSIGYEHILDHTSVYNSRNSLVYHLLFASKHPRGEYFFKQISKRTYTGQSRMPLL